MTVLVAGGAGFIGSNFVRYYVQAHPLDTIVNVDKLTYAGNMDNLIGLADLPNYRFVKADICDQSPIESIVQEFSVTSLVNFAAETHVDRSILGPAEFIQTNVMGTQALLEVAKKFSLHRYVQVSTDEVYGSLGTTGKFTEQTHLHPNSPYAASKASADLLCLAYHHTFGLPALITRCSNNYGPYQFPEKLIPLMILHALHDKPLPIYGDGKNVRDWLHVLDHCRAIDAVLAKGKVGEVYNIGGNNEWQNIDIVKLILNRLRKPESLISFVKDRLGHDRRYAIDSTKIQRELGWVPQYDFDRGIVETIEWYTANQQWWGRILTGEYQSYYKMMYEGRENA
ncbi:MAG: dTDP-glucose 4,6-dehydratase [Ignavibacteriales bacterium]|nr:dTDP-glucose 4,6-dehydratase [Ignavibacteriales bacterium]